MQRQVYLEWKIYFSFLIVLKSHLKNTYAHVMVDCIFNKQWSEIYDYLGIVFIWLIYMSLVKFCSLLFIVILYSLNNIVIPY